jgi:uncharacterized alkaline shock family protein YloU
MDERNIIIEDIVVQKIAGIAAQEVEGIQMGGGTAAAISGFLDSVTGDGGVTRGVSVQVGGEEAVIDLSMAVEYGKSIPQLTEAVRRNIVSRVENITGLRVVEINITVNDILLPEERSQLDRQRKVQREAQSQHIGGATPAAAGGVTTPGTLEAEPPVPPGGRVRPDTPPIPGNEGRETPPAHVPPREPPPEPRRESPPPGPPPSANPPA